MKLASFFLQSHTHCCSSYECAVFNRAPSNLAAGLAFSGGNVVHTSPTMHGLFSLLRDTFFQIFTVVHLPRRFHSRRASSLRQRSHSPENKPAQRQIWSAMSYPSSDIQTQPAALLTFTSMLSGAAHVIVGATTASATEKPTCNNHRHDLHIYQYQHTKVSSTR